MNPIESAFSSIRLRTTGMRSYVTRAAALAMSFRLAQLAQTRRKRLRGCELLEEVITGIRFKDGILKAGNQIVSLRIEKGRSRGVVLENCRNGLSGKLERDKILAPGDAVLLTIKYGEDGKTILYTNIVDHYRFHVELILALLYVGVLVFLSGWTGLKAVLSFVFSVVAIWKWLLPGVLKGQNAILLALLVVLVLTFVIIFLVAGFNKKGLVAFLGSALGVGATCAFSIFFGREFMVDGSVMPFGEALLYAGFININLTEILFASIFLASSGAVMDVAMDIASALDEIKAKRPDIGMRELIGSGISVSRMLIGTMTTTLLLAYTGSYMTTMMSFIAMGIPIMNVLNIRYVSSEILTTLVGSFGLVLVAPFTSLVAGIVYCKKKPPIE